MESHFSAFSDEAFDAKEWINKALKSTKPDETPEGTGQLLVLKLQSFIQKVNSELEDTSQQIVKDLPSVIRSVDSVTQEVASLKERMGLVKEDIEQVEKDTAQSMSLLVTLDNLKSRMEETSGALQEADNWTTLSADVEKAFQADDIKKIASTLLGMQRSLMVLSDVPDYDERKAHLLSLQNKLEATISPKFVNAVTSRNFDAAKECVVIFSDMQRLPQLCSYYYGCHKSVFTEQWTKIIGEEGSTLQSKLDAFYEILIMFCNKERPWLRTLFPEAPSMISTLLCQTIQGCRPTLGECIEKDTDGAGSGQLQKVIDAYQATTRFASQLDFVEDGELFEALFSPYAHYQIEYGNLQSHALEKSFEEIQIESDDHRERISEMNKSIPVLFRHLDKAITSCLELTAGNGFEGLCCSVMAMLSKYCTLLSESVDEMKRATKEDSWENVEDVLYLIQVCGSLMQKFISYENKVRTNILERKVALLGAKNMDVKFNYLHDRPRPRQSLQRFVDAVEKGQPALPEAQEAISQLIAVCHQYAFDTLLAPILEELKPVAAMEEWKSSATSDFSLPPLGYITSIGEKLLTLPQQFEPFSTQESNMVSFALQWSPLPFSDGEMSADDSDATAEIWLASVARGAIASYIEEVQKIAELSDSGTSQLCADIDYLCNVLSALDVIPQQELSQLSQLLAVPKEKYKTTEESLVVDPELSTRIAKMRGVK